ncbi:MAG: Ig-like domain-containing protein [Blastocatellia bacterium]
MVQLPARFAVLLCLCALVFCAGMVSRASTAAGLRAIAAVTSWPVLATPTRAAAVQSSGTVAVVSAASYEAAAIAPGAIVSAFGTNLATQSASATTLPLPTNLGGTTVEISGQAAQLFFVSPGQVNFVIPNTVAASPTASVTVRAANGATATATIQIQLVAPAIFSANSDGAGVPASNILRVKANGDQIYETLSQFNAVTSRFNTKPLDLGPDGERVFLVLFLTGIRRTSDPDNDGNFVENTRMVIGGTEIVPAYAGPQPGFVGLDQINAEIPRGLIGRGRVNIGVSSTGFVSSNLGEIEIAGPIASPAPPVINGFGSATVLAGQNVNINGSGFSTNPADNSVRMAGSEADLNTASTTQLSITVPFGAETGMVTVRTPQGEGTSASPLAVRTSISGFIEDTGRQPMTGMTVKLLGAGAITTTTNTEGMFILPDVPAGAALVEIDGTNITTPPFPKITLKTSVSANRDNQFMQPIAMQQAVGPGLPVGTGGGAPSFDNQVEAGAEVNGSVTTNGVTLDVPPGVATFPDGSTGGNIILTVIENSRTPVGLPVGFFSSVIAQISPIGVTLNPGGRLLFPNPDNLAPGAQTRLFRFDQTEGSPTIGSFVEVGTATVSADGQRIETAVGAITRTGIYFVSAQLQTTTVIGRVVDSNGTAPLRRVLVRARGREAFTDGNGGFILRHVPVRPGEQISVEISFLRPNGRLEKAQSASVPVVINGLTIIPFARLGSVTINRAPVIQGPFSIMADEGAVTDYKFTASDPDRGQAVNVTATGAGFSIPVQNFGDFYFLRLSPGFNDAGTYTLTIRATDPMGLSTTRTVSVVVRDVNRAPALLNPGARTLNEGTSVGFTLSASDPDTGQTLTYSMSNAPPEATLNPQTGAFSYTAPFTVASRAQPAVTLSNIVFTVTDNGTPARNASQAIAITVNNVNRNPTAIPVNRTINEDTPTLFNLNASDPDGDPLTYTLVNRPQRGALTGNFPDVTYAPNLDYNGGDSFSYRVNDGLLNSNEALVLITITPVNDPPALTVPGSQFMNEGQTLVFTIMATDVENNQINLTVTGMPAGARFDNVTGTFSWTPGFAQAAGYVVTFRATDNGTPAATTTRTVSINVNDVQHDLASDPDNFTVWGDKATAVAVNDSGDALGSSIAVGDLDGDGVADLAMGAPFANGAGFDHGRVYIFFGRLQNGIIDLQFTNANLTLTGENAGDWFGASLAIADVNGNGIGDLLIGAPGADFIDASGKTRADCGKAYVVSGKPAAGASGIAQVASFTVAGANAADQLGFSVAAGPVLAKTGAATMIVSAPLYDQIDPIPTLAPEQTADTPDAGRVYLFAGGAGLTGIHDLSAKAATFSVTGTANMSRAGWSLATGDVNGDGFADLAIGAPFSELRSQRGLAYLVYGNANLAGDRAFGSFQTDLRVLGRNGSDLMGYAMSIGDLNNDGFGDLILGAPGGDGFGDQSPNSGEVYVTYGRATLTGTLDFTQVQADTTIFGGPAGPNATLGLGASVATGDFTGDGITDLALGAPGVAFGVPRADCGAVYLYFGEKNQFPMFSEIREIAPPLQIFGADIGDRLGLGGMAIGDVTGSAPADLILGAPLGNSIGNQRPGAGEVRILFGRIR